MRLVYLPAYSPELTLIKRLWHFCYRRSKPGAICRRMWRDNKGYLIPPFFTDSMYI
ncbi:MAG: hypothetical protein GXP08_00585 [Gammaproteobacteria bacterium]|nr:hypothetical protein [Gammaproteobacteria bacterium]